MLPTIISCPTQLILALRVKAAYQLIRVVNVKSGLIHCLVLMKKEGVCVGVYLFSLMVTVGESHQNACYNIQRLIS